MDPHPLRLLETAPPLRSSTLSANPANSRFRVRQDHRLASSEVVNKISSKTLTDQLRSLVQQGDYRVHQTMSDRIVVATEKTALLRRSEFDAIAKNVRVGYVFFFDDRDEYLEGNRVVG